MDLEHQPSKIGYGTDIFLFCRVAQFHCLVIVNPYDLEQNDRNTDFSLKG